MTTTHPWEKITRDRLRGFDEDQTKAVLYAMECGGVGRISSNGHCIIRNDRGQTMSISRQAKGRNKQNVAADLVRLFGAPLEREQPQQATGTDGPKPTLTAVPTAKPQDPMPCPVEGCAYTFVTEGARYQHVHARHHPCRESGCDEVLDTAVGEAFHHYREHGDRMDLATVPGRLGIRVRELRQAAGISQRELAARLSARGVPGMQHQTSLSGLERGEPQSLKASALWALAEELGPELFTALIPGGVLPDPQTPAPAQEQPPGPAPEPAATVPARGDRPSAEQTLAEVRRALGEDPRIAEMQERVAQQQQTIDALIRDRDDANTQLSLVREALRLQ